MVSNFIIMTSGKHAAPVFVYHHLPVCSIALFFIAGVAIGFSTVDALTAPSSQMETGLQMLQSLEGEQQAAVQAAEQAAAGSSPVAGVRPPALVIPPGTLGQGSI